MIYLDYVASAPIWPEILKKHQELAEKWFYNPHGSSSYCEEAMREIVLAKRKIFKLLTIPENEADIIWTSGGTESNNLALLSVLKDPKMTFFHLDPTAHPSQLQCWPFAQKLLVDHDGNLLADKNDQDGAVALCLVNNETGKIQDLKYLRSLYPRAVFLIDAVQAIGKTDILWKEGKIDYLSLGSRKIGGPRGLGALIYRKNRFVNPMILGGDQQKSLRSGTLDTIGIIEFVKALEMTLEDKTDYVNLNLYLQEILKNLLPCRYQIISNSPSTPKILTISIPDYQSAILVRGLAEQKIILATGSACRAESGKNNHVLNAMKYSEEVSRGTIRFSFGPTTSKKDLQETVIALVGLIKSY